MPREYHIELLFGYDDSGRALYDIHVCDIRGNTHKRYPDNDDVRFLKLSTRIALAEAWIERNR